MTTHSLRFGGSIEPGTVKICGLREPADAVAAAVAGADLLGFIFAPTRRYVSPEAARACIAAARAADAGRRIRAVGVFVDASAAEINATADRADLDLVQLSGDEPPELVNQIDHPVLRALRPEPGATADGIVSHLAPFGRSRPAAFLLDGFHAGAYGGMGVRADWSLAAALAPSLPMLLAGGLRPENVADAIASVRPLGVDVSSGVETDGIKNAVLIAAFVRAAKAAFSTMP